MIVSEKLFSFLIGKNLLSGIPKLGRFSSHFSNQTKRKYSRGRECRNERRARKSDGGEKTTFTVIGLDGEEGTLTYTRVRVIPTTVVFTRSCLKGVYTTENLTGPRALNTVKTICLCCADNGES